MAGGYSLLNSVAVKEIASKVLFENIVQENLIVPGRGADFRYTTDLNGNSVAVQRTKLIAGGREIKNGLTNGGYINSGMGTLESQIFDIPLNVVYDKAVVVPATAEIMNGDGQLLKSTLQNVPKAMARTINSAYFATIIAANLNSAISATAVGSTVTYAISDDYVSKMSADTSAAALSATKAAFANLDEGDIANGFDIFPQTNTELFVTGSFYSKLTETSNAFVGNFIGQQMIASGSFSAFESDYTPDVIKGYAGEFNGALVYKVGSLFTTAEGWIGQKTLSDGSLEAIASGSLAHLGAILVCGLAVGGGIDLRKEVKVIDAKGGQGWEVQPLGRCGFSVFSPKGVQLITDSTGLTASNFVTYSGSDNVATKTKASSIYAPENRG